MLESAAGELTIAGVSRMIAMATATATSRRRGAAPALHGRTPVVCGDRLNTSLDGVKAMPCASRFSAGALPHATTCQTSSAAQATPTPRGPNRATGTATAAHAAAMADSGMVARTALARRDGVLILGVRRKTPRSITSALTHARVTVRVRANITIAASGTSRHGARQATCTLHPRRRTPATSRKIGSASRIPIS